MSTTISVHGRETLASGPIARIELCECGCIHLTLGALTLRLDASATESLWATLGEALGTLARSPTARTSVTPCARGAS